MPPASSAIAAAAPTVPLQPTVFYFCRMGDMIMVTPLLDLLHRRYQRPCLMVGAGSWNDALYQGNSDVARLWSFTRHLPFVFNRNWPSLRRALRASDPGPIYVCESHYRQLPRIRRMLAVAGVNPARCVFISDEPNTGPEHLVDRLTRFAERTPAALDTGEYPVLPASSARGPRICVLDSERAERDAWLQSRGWVNRQLILVQPGNHRTMSRRRGRWRRLGTDDKAWPQQHWVELLGRIHARMPQALIVLRGSQEEVPMLHQIQAAAGLESVVVAGDNLRQFFALAELAHSMVSVDTGPAHGAAALGIPLVVLFGAHSPRYWAPRTGSASPVIGLGGPPVATRADQITVETVYQAWCTVIAPSLPAQGAAGAR
jgi:ADP-heptose:LPS heptosyltransferase